MLEPPFLENQTKYGKIAPLKLLYKLLPFRKTFLKTRKQISFLKAAF